MSTHKILKRHKTADLSRYYIDKDEYTNEILKYKKTEDPSERLGELWKLHVDKCASAASFKSYTYLDEMKGYALLFLVKYSKSFNPHIKLKSGLKADAFKYCTTIIHRAFIQIINKEKKHSKLKDKIIKVRQRVLYNIGQQEFPLPIDDE